MSIFIFYPFQHLTTSVIIEVCIDIRQRYTVGIQETLKQQIILQWVNLRNSQTIGHHTTSCGATSWPHHDIQFITCRVDKVLHDEEVTGEAHRLHDVQFKPDTVLHILRQWLAITAISAFICQFSQIISLELDAVNLIVATQLLNLLLPFLWCQLVLAILITGKLLIQVILRELLPPLFFRTERLRNGEERHNRVMVQAVDLYLVENLQRVRQSLRHITKNLIHLCLSLKPLLFRVEHTSRIIQILTR